MKKRNQLLDLVTFAKTNDCVIVILCVKNDHRQCQKLCDTLSGYVYDIIQKYGYLNTTYSSVKKYFRVISFS